MTMPKTSSKRSTRQKKRDQRREAIKLAAIDVFASKGYHGAKVSDIVEHVGVAQGTFYLYYGGKQQLFGELLTDFFALVVQTVSNWEPGQLAGVDELEHELKRVGLMLTQVLEDNKKLTTVFFKEALAVNHEFDATIRTFYATLTTMLTTFNGILCTRGIIQPMNFRLLAIATIGQVERIISEHLIHNAFGDIGQQELVDHLVVLFLHGTREPIAAPSQPDDT